MYFALFYCTRSTISLLSLRFLESIQEEVFDDSGDGGHITDVEVAPVEDVSETVNTEVGFHHFDPSISDLQGHEMSGITENSFKAREGTDL